MRRRLLYLASASIFGIFASTSLARANDLPIKTNPNLVHFGYYHIDTTIHGGPYYNEVFPYTNLFIPIGPNPCDISIVTFLNDYQNRVANAFNSGKDIYAMVGPQGTCPPPPPPPAPQPPPDARYPTRAELIARLANYWSRVKYVEVLHEPNGLTAAQVDNEVTLTHNAILAASLPAKPYGIMQSACAASNGAGCAGEHAAKTASLLNFVGIEAYVNVTQTATDQINLLNAAKAATPAGKSIVLVGMSFDRNLSNVDIRHLRSLQKAVYLAGYNDSRVTAITMFVYGRQDMGFKSIGGARLYPELKIAHYQMAERILGWTPPAFTVNHRQYLAEGAQSGMFNTAIAIANPNGVYSHARVQFRRTDGFVGSQYTLLPPFSRTMVYPEDIGGFAATEFGTVVESDQKLAVERIMRWDATGYGLTLESGVDSPGTQWYLAEGTTGGSFNTYYLLQNPNGFGVNATVTYLRPAPAPPLTITYPISANSRLTIDVNGVPGLGATDVSASISATNNIVVERAMYFTGSGPLFRAGMTAVGVKQPSTSLYFAEGSTGFFSMYLLLANPNSSTANVQATYYVQGGAPVVLNYAVPGNSRVTIDVNAQPGLASVPLSVRLVSLNGVGIVAERTMLWGAGWYEGHTSAGVSQTGTAWAVAGAEVGLKYGSNSYVLVANTGLSAGTATVTLLFGDNNCFGGPGACTVAQKTINLPAQSRTTLDLPAEFPNAFRDQFGNFVGRTVAVRVQSNGVPIVVEHAMYSASVPGDGQQWTAGGAAVATRLF